jgi:hypothetical protein
MATDHLARFTIDNGKVCQFAKFVATRGKLLCRCKPLAADKLRHVQGHVCQFAKGHGAWVTVARHQSHQPQCRSTADIGERVAGHVAHLRRFPLDLDGWLMTIFVATLGILASFNLRATKVPGRQVLVRQALGEGVLKRSPPPQASASRRRGNAADSRTGASASADRQQCAAFCAKSGPTGWP